MVITLNVILMKSELGTDGHRVPAPMHTHCVVIERDALCPRQIRIGGCEMKINYEAAVTTCESHALVDCCSDEDYKQILCYRG